jgi:hypothetical protein
MRERFCLGSASSARQRKKEETMEVMYARCCGLDVHKESISACVLVVEGGRREKQMRRVGTTT